MPRAHAGFVRAELQAHLPVLLLPNPALERTAAASQGQYFSIVGMGPGGCVEFLAGKKKSPYGIRTHVVYPKYLSV
jgi:hypothetical protein